MANSAVPSKQWVKTGLDFVKDGLWGRLGVQENFGSTWIAGAINGLAVHENAQNGKTLFYAGSVNGGVYLRTYDRQTDQWDESWQPLSRPGSGYEGSQSITQLAVSDDGHYPSASTLALTSRRPVPVTADRFTSTVCAAPAVSNKAFHEPTCPPGSSTTNTRKPRR